VSQAVTPLFSVIITVYNRPELVGQAIASVLAQTFQDREIIVVDDASSDSTSEVLAAYADRVRVITRGSRGGCELARADGVDVAVGGYLAFLDSDDLFYPWALETYALVIEANRNPALVVSRLAQFANAPKSSTPPTTSGDIKVITFKDYLSKDRTIAVSFSMIVVRRDVHRNAGGFRRSDPSTFNGSDHDFLLRVGCEGPAILVDFPQTVAYRIHSGNSVRDLERVIEGILRLIAAERRGAYPGGRARQLDRRSLIGNQTYWWTRSALLQRKPWLALRLSFTGFDMIVARLLKKWEARGSAPMPVKPLTGWGAVSPSR
jgi:glycosyltransferase involved in cell wall biosynthesis